MALGRNYSCSPQKNTIGLFWPNTVARKTLSFIALRAALTVQNCASRHPPRLWQRKGVMNERPSNLIPVPLSRANRGAGDGHCRTYLGDRGLIDAQTLTHIRGLQLPPLPGRLLLPQMVTCRGVQPPMRWHHGPRRWAGEYRFCLPLMAGIGTTFFS